MQTNRTKLLSLVLAVMMVVGMLPITGISAFATGTDVAKIGVTGYATLAEAVAAANDGDTIVLADGTHTLPATISSAQGPVARSITFEGTKSAVIDMTNGVTAADCTLIFDGVTLAFTQANYKGMYHAAKEVYRNCTITGLQTLYAPTVEFTNCEFTNLNGYNLWTYGAKDVAFSDCTFYSGGRCVYVYNEMTTDSFTADLSFKDCVFNDDDSLKEDNGIDDLKKGAVETGSNGKNNETANKYKITFINCTANGFHENTTGNTLWGNKHNLDADHLVVDVHTEHIWDEGIADVPATADTNGVMVYTCTVCGATKSVIIPKTGHAFDAGEVVAPTCTEQGYTIYTCTDAACDYSYKADYTDATGHTITDDVKQPTCTSKGYTTYTCSGCGYITIADYVPALGHSWNNGEETTPATGDTEGVMTYTCTVCGAKKTEVIQATGHNFTQVVNQPTCTEQGYTTYTCTTCANHTYEGNYVPATGHTLVSDVTEPTCTEKGYTIHTCTVDGCGYTLKSAYTEMIAHNYVYDSILYATADTEGKVVYVCSCGAEKLEIIPAIGHSFTPAITKDATCDADGIRTYTCGSCDNHTYTEIIPATGHTWNTGDVTQPSCTAGGYTTYTCTVDGCGATRIANQTPMLDHDFDATTGMCEYTDCDAVNVNKADTLAGSAEEKDDITVESAGFTSAEAVKDAMEAATNTNASNVTSTLYEITLKAGDKALTANNFPTDGFVFEIPLPNGVAADNITVSHMITETYGGHVAGDVEILNHWIDGDKICFRTYSTSPVMLSIVTEEKGSLKGYTVTLGDNIGVNFYMSLSDTTLADDNAYMLFTLPDGTTTKVFVKDVKDNPVVNNSITNYVFTCNVAAKEMTDNILAQFIVGGSVIEEKEYSVEEYALYIINHTNVYDSDEIALAKALLNYGATAQQMFKYNTYELANSGLSDKTIGDVNASDLISYAKNVDNGIEGVSYLGTTAVWENKMSVRHYFNIVSNNITFKLYDSNNQFIKDLNVEDGTYGKYVEIDGIVAADMKTSYVLKISNGTNEQTITYSVYSYFYDILRDSTNRYSEAEKNAVKAAYIYSQAAITYLTHSNN